MSDTSTVLAAPLERVKSKGYYKDTATGEKYTSVTTILGRTVSKGEALTIWAANTVARCAMNHLPYLTRSSRDEAGRVDAYKWLKGAAARKRDERKEVGGAVHSLIEHRVLGTPVPAEVRENEELAPYLANFERFVRDWKVTFTASEMVVLSVEHGYAGTLDYLFTSPLIARELGTDPKLEHCGDIKTGGELDERTMAGDLKGVYPEAALQEAAYSHAQFAQLRDGRRVPMPPVAEMGMVLHLRPEGYRVVPVRIDEATFAAFLSFARLDAQWTTGSAKTVVGQPLANPTDPTTDTKEAA